MTAPNLQERWLYNLSMPFSYLFLEHEGKNAQPSFYLKPTTLEAAFKGWDIADRVSLLETIEGMTEDGHANRSNLAYAIYSRGLPSEWDRHKAEEKSEFNRFIDYMVEKTGHLVQNGGIRAWDYSRMSHLARSGLATNLITSDEMLWIHYELALRSQYFFNSWIQFFTSHFVGWHYWRLYNSEANSLNEWIAAFTDQSHFEYQQQFNHVMCDPDSADISWHLYIEPIEKPDSMVEISW